MRRRQTTRFSCRRLPSPVSGWRRLPSSNEFVLVLIRAMIAAAKADGHIDDAERALIMDKVKAADVSGEAAAFIEQELASPTDIDALVAAATTEEQRVELYTASRLTIDPDSRAERGYLDLLASPPRPCRPAGRPYRGNGVLRQGDLVTVTSRPVAFVGRLAYPLFRKGEWTCAILQISRAARRRSRSR